MAKSRTVVQVEGGRELRRTLRQAGNDLEDLKRAHAEAAAIVVPRGSSKAPKGLTGRLAGSVRGSGTKTAALVRAGYAAIPYAGVQEWGWPARNIPAQHYLTEAATETEPAWFPRYEAEVDRILGKVKGA